MWLVWLFRNWENLSADGFKIQWVGDSIGYCEIYADRDKALEATGGNEDLIQEIEFVNKEA